MAASVVPGRRVIFTSTITGKSLRMLENGRINAKGGRGKWAQFDIVAGETPGTIMLRSVGIPAAYIAIDPETGRPIEGKGGRYSQFTVGEKKGNVILRAAHIEPKKPRKKGVHLGARKNGHMRNCYKNGPGKKSHFTVEVIGDAPELSTRDLQRAVYGIAEDDDLPDEVPVAKERKRALLVGCNYPGTRAELRGCVNDVWMMHKVLVEVKGFDPASIRVMIDTDPKYERPTGRNIKRALRELVTASQPGDVLFFHFSGHGTQVPAEGTTESDGKDEAICPTDMNLIVDGDLREILEDMPHGVHLTFVSDCCHSGGMIDGRTVQIGDEAAGAKPQARPAGSQHRDLPEGMVARDLPIDIIAQELADRTGKPVQPENMRRSLFGLFGGDVSHMASSFVGFFSNALGMDFMGNDDDDADDSDDDEPEQHMMNQFFAAPAADHPQPTSSLVSLFGGSAEDDLYSGPLPANTVPLPKPGTKPDIDVQLPGDKGILICGCQSHQTSADCCPGGDPSKAYGALTHTLTSMVRSNPKINAFDLVANVRKELARKGFSQQPGLECTNINARKQFVCASV